MDGTGVEYWRMEPNVRSGVLNIKNEVDLARI